jgi:PEP-utilising enzyme, PEP-binding domain/PEP-utilising enzyme, mobile domain
MHSAVGVLTALGGMTSHAAVVARGWGKPCVVGCAGLSFNDIARTATLGGRELSEGDMISLNGATGEIVWGAAELAAPQLEGDVAEFMEWADRYRKLAVMANADSPEDAAQVRAQSLPASLCTLRNGCGTRTQRRRACARTRVCACFSQPARPCARAQWLRQGVRCALTCAHAERHVPLLAAGTATVAACKDAHDQTYKPERRTAVQARKNGAQGAGLVRTEHMFFATDDRIRAVRRMIFSRDGDERSAALGPIEAFHRDDFRGIFKAFDGLPVTIRLLDPPLHEFLPPHDNQAALSQIAADVGMSVAEVRTAAAAMREVNPMLGFRGCRLAIAYPEIPRAQARPRFFSCWLASLPRCCAGCAKRRLHMTTCRLAEAPRCTSAAVADAYLLLRALLPLTVSELVQIDERGAACRCAQSCLRPPTRSAMAPP